jgi:hypothetical protein
VKTWIGTTVGWCPVHEKLFHPNRKSARRVARRHTAHMSVYKCDDQPYFWHVGTLPPKVISGEMSRADLVKRDAA